MTIDTHFIPEHISFFLFKFPLKRHVGSEHKRLSRHQLPVIYNVTELLKNTHCLKCTFTVTLEAAYIF